MKRVHAKTHRVRNFGIADPIGLPEGGSLLPWLARGAAKRGSISIIAAHDGASGWVARTRDLIEAAGARVEWSDADPATGSMERVLAATDAVVVSSALALAADRSRARRFHSVATSVSTFGSNLPLGSLHSLDLLLVGPTRPNASSWERSVRLACRWAREEGRARVHCAVRDPGWPILASDRASRFRRVAREHLEVEALRTSFQDARRRLLFEAGAYDVLVADADDLDSLARSARSGVGWCSASPSFLLGESCTLLDLDLANSARARSAEAALAVSLALVRLLRHLGDRVAAACLAAALRSEVAERVELASDLWLDLASETPERFLDAVRERLTAQTPPAN